MELVNCSVNTIMHTIFVSCSLCKSWVGAVWVFAGDSQGVGMRDAMCQVLADVLSVPGPYAGPL